MDLRSVSPAGEESGSSAHSSVPFQNSKLRRSCRPGRPTGRSSGTTTSCSPSCGSSWGWTCPRSPRTSCSVSRRCRWSSCRSKDHGMLSVVWSATGLVLVEDEVVVHPDVPVEGVVRANYQVGQLPRHVVGAVVQVAPVIPDLAGPVHDERDVARVDAVGLEVIVPAGPCGSANTLEVLVLELNVNIDLSSPTRRLAHRTRTRCWRR